MSFLPLEIYSDYSEIQRDSFNVPVGCNVNTNLASNYVTIYSQNTQILHTIQTRLTVGSSFRMAFNSAPKRYRLISDVLETCVYFNVGLKKVIFLLLQTF